MDIASLGIKIDTSDAAKAATDLDKITEAGVGVEGAAKRTGSAWEKAFAGLTGDTQQIVKELQALNAKQDTTAQLMATIGKSLVEVSQGFSKTANAASQLAVAEVTVAESAGAAEARLLAVAKASLESSEYYQRLTTSVNTTTTAMDHSGSSVSSLAALKRRLQAESDALVGSTDKETDAAKRATAATGVQAEGLQALLAKINPTIAAYERLDQYQELLKQHLKCRKHRFRPVQGVLSGYRKNPEQAGRLRRGVTQDRGICWPDAGSASAIACAIH